jgi:protein-L-isoaspartate(D-aspartate) O-methyltransferase
MTRRWSAQVEAALDAVPRTGFLPPSAQRSADADRPLPIGHDQTNSQPSTVAAMLDLLDARPGHRVLDVGAGSGWTTALLAHLVGPTGRVLGVERVPELVVWGAANLAATHQPWAEIRPATPGTIGLPDEGPFDRILVSAGAAQLPTDLVDQLGPDGVLVIPVAGEMLRLQRRGVGLGTTRHGRYAFVPLIR